MSLLKRFLLFTLLIFMPKAAYAQNGPPNRTPNSIPLFGNVTSPYGEAYHESPFGLIYFLTNILRLIFLIAGLFALFKIVLAGFGWITAGGEPKKIEQAWANIWQSIVGLLIIVSSFALAAIIGQLFFGDMNYILTPALYGVGSF